jgi:hypothetical protein
LIAIAVTALRDVFNLDLNMGEQRSVSGSSNRLSTERSLLGQADIPHSVYGLFKSKSSPVSLNANLLMGKTASQSPSAVEDPPLYPTLSRVKKSAPHTSAAASKSLGRRVTATGETGPKGTLGRQNTAGELSDNGKRETLRPKDRESTTDKRKAMSERISKGLLIGGDKRLKGNTTDLLSDSNGLALAEKLFDALAGTRI